jgi:hypothetical protein
MLCLESGQSSELDNTTLNMYCKMNKPKLIGNKVKGKISKKMNRDLSNCDKIFLVELKINNALFHYEYSFCQPTRVPSAVPFRFVTRIHIKMFRILQF